MVRSVLARAALVFLLSTPSRRRDGAGCRDRHDQRCGQRCVRGVLPGVTVEAASPALIEKVRTAVTDGQGVYRIVDLRPGSYAVTFTLTGFTGVRREGVELTTGFTATVNAELSVGNVQETITVSGAAPLVDTRTSRSRPSFRARSRRRFRSDRTSGTTRRCCRAPSSPAA